jgi:hypothetical protein
MPVGNERKEEARKREEDEDCEEREERTIK